MLVHRKSLWKRLSASIKIVLSILAFGWILSQAFVIMCRWSEVPAFGTCSGIIDHMCAEYSRNKISGNLCLELCQNTSSELFQCRHVSGEGKKVIFFRREDNSKLVLKTKSLTPAELELTRSDLESQAGGDSIASIVNYLRIISQHIFIKNETFTRFINHLDMTSHNTLAAAASGQSLLHQEEYVTTNNYQSASIVPKLHGACGNFYAVDFTPTDGVLLTNNLQSGWPWRSIGSWESRRTIAIRLLELAERLDDHNLSFCDVKGSNFGQLEDGKVAVLDSDSLFTKEELGSIFKEDKCYKDSDCSFWDCRGTCNWRTRKCLQTVSSTNYHVICAKLFRHHSSNAFHGILEDASEKRKAALDIHLSSCGRRKLTEGESRNGLVSIRKLLLHDQILG